MRISDWSSDVCSSDLSPRLLLRLSVWVGFIVGTPVVGGQFTRSWPIPGWRGVRGASPHRQRPLAAATQDPQHQRLRSVVDAGAEAGQVAEAAAAGGDHHVTLAQAVALGAGRSEDRRGG